MGMRLSEWRKLLTVDDGKSKHDEDFMALCPCHNDHDASLHVYIGGDGQIVMKCFACGADRKDVAEKLGYRLQDVAVDARTGEPPFGVAGKGNTKPATGKTGRQRKVARPFTLGDVWKLGKGDKRLDYKIAEIYEYEDATGRVVLRKARLEAYGEDGKRIKKSFFVQSLGVDGKWYSDDGIYGGLMYHLPEVKRAIADGAPVFLVEGEKDVESLRKLGYTATCNLYGGGKQKLVGKWSDDHTRAIAGAKRVIVIPDNDGAGEGLAQWICKHIREHVDDLRILRIADLVPGFAEKGDFTDFVLLRKSQGVRTKSALRKEFEQMIASAPAWTPDNVRQFQKEGNSGEAVVQNAGEADEDGESYFDVYGYCVRYGRLCKRTRDGSRPLCDFVPIPKETITRDDGSGTQTEYIIGATAASGRTLQDAHIRSDDEFYSMRWPLTAWGFDGNILAQNGAERQVREAIMRAGQRLAVNRTIYEHTGFKKIGDRVCYLYNGGAIGADNVSVELRNNLKYYDLSAEDGIDAADAVAATYMLITDFPARICIPILAQTFLGPLYSIMEEMEEPPAYVIYVRGETGTFKSTFVSYALAHFGRFYNRRFTATFQDTGNSARDKTFPSKDVLYVVDDYNPEGDKRQAAKMDMLANAVITAIADRAERGSLQADKKLREARPARCTCIMTGEQLPNLNQGRVLRLYIIDVEKGDIAPEGNGYVLEDYAKYARRGLYRACMRGYIESLIRRWDGLKEEIDKRLEEAKDTVYQDELIPKKYARMQEAAAHLLMGAGMMIDYLIEAEAPIRETREEFMELAWKAIRTNVLRQSDAIEESTPARRYLEAVQSLIRLKAVNIIDLNDINAAAINRPNTIGWKDKNYYYLELAATDRQVRMLWKDSGAEIGASNTQIRRQMCEYGILAGGSTKDGRDQATFVKRIGSASVRVMRFPLHVIEGNPKPNPREGFTEIEGEQQRLPF